MSLRGQLSKEQIGQQRMSEIPTMNLMKSKNKGSTSTSERDQLPKLAPKGI